MGARKVRSSNCHPTEGRIAQKSIKTTTDIAIIGAGVIGCSIAYHLRKAGREVVVFERGEIGGEASGAAAGLLAPLGPLSGPGPLADLLMKGFARFPDLVAELEEASGLALEYEQIGALRVVREPRRIPHLQKRMQKWEPLGLRLHWLSGDEARQREPLLSPEISAAVYAPEEAQINASQVVKAFARAAMNLGACFNPHTENTGIHHHKARITTLTTAQGQSIHCEHLIIA
jgi:glycine oxidase